jgi:ABC-2 type transport system permease protein
MTSAIRDNGYIFGRDARRLARQPAYILITLIQPILWLLLFGALFQKVVDIPGFSGGDYIQFLAPGVVIMTALFSAGWAGFGMLQDIERGILDRLLVSPIFRPAMIGGRLLQNALVTTIQSLIIIALALIVGASFPEGIGGVAVLIAIAIVLGAIFSAFSNGVALLVRKEETLIAVINILLLPLTFLSSTFMQKSLMPGWMQTVADFNPVNWAVEAGRAAVTANTDWGFVVARVGLLAGLLVAATLFATSAFRAYQRSV